MLKLFLRSNIIQLYSKVTIKIINITLILEHEKYVTSLINEIYGAAYDVRDFRTMQFLDWFVKEQGEEETRANDLISKMELFGTDPKSLYMLNQELATRVYAAPSLVL